MPTLDTASAPLKPDIFEILVALEDGPQHGYAILQELAARGHRVAASLLYRKLERLVEQRLVEETAERPEHDDLRRRYSGVSPMQAWH